MVRIAINGPLEGTVELLPPNTALSSDSDSNNKLIVDYTSSGASDTLNPNSVIVGKADPTIGTALNNELYINKGAYIKGNAIGGQAYNASTDYNEASNNSVYSYGDAYIAGGIMGGDAAGNGTVLANSNTINVYDNVQTRSTVQGGSATSTDVNGANISASNNTVNVSGNATLGGYGVIGGYVRYSSSSLTGTVTIAADNNVVNASGNVTAFGIIAGKTDPYAGSESMTVTANNNIINVTDNVQVSNYIYGAYAGGWSGTANNKLSDITLSNNTINASGSVSTNQIYGAYADLAKSSTEKVILNMNNNTINASDNIQVAEIVGGGVGLGGNTAETELYANGNIINISGNATVSDRLMGGYANSFSNSNMSYNLFSGNTLNYSAAPNTVNTLGNFENYNFSLTQENQQAINSGVGLITVNGEFKNDAIHQTDGSIIDAKSNIKLTGISGSQQVKAGDQVVLIDAGSATTTTTAGSSSMSDMFNTPQPNTVKVGLINKTDVNYVVDDATKTVTAVIGSVGVDRGSLDQMKALSESRLAGLAGINRGADLVSDQVFRNIKNIKERSLTPFFTMVGGHDRYNTGSHINTDSYTLTTGLAYKIDRLTLGVLYEYGDGDYDTYNSFNVGNVHGKGNTHHSGAGIIANYQYDDFYLDTSLRAGTAKINYHTDNIITGGGARVSYNKRADYWGGACCNGLCL